MNKHLIILGIAVLLLVVGLSGCNEKNNEEISSPSLIGTWSAKYEGVEFPWISTEYIHKISFSDEHIVYLTTVNQLSGGVSTLKCSYEIAGDTLYITHIESGYTVSFDYSFGNPELREQVKKEFGEEHLYLNSRCYIKN